jgi:hypothetical protein
MCWLLAVKAADFLLSGPALRGCAKPFTICTS